MSDTCPKCGPNYNGRPALNRHDYWCGSTTWVDGDFYQSPECLRRERDQLLERIKRLEENLADRERERDHVNDTADAALAENKALAEKVKLFESALSDPAAVWSNMLRGTIAMPPHIPELEGRLTDTHARIQTLEAALDLVFPRCEHLHHKKKHRHLSHEPCPVEEIVRKAKGQP